MNARPVIVIEDDPFPRILQVILDPGTSTERRDAFAHFMAQVALEFVQQQPIDLNGVLQSRLFVVCGEGFRL